MTAATVDPRLQARRVAVRRARGRRRLRVLIAAVSLLTLSGVAWGLTRTALLDVDRIVVGGIPPDQSSEVIDAAGIGPGLALLDIDTSAAAEAIEALPWVESATVRRRWPGAISVKVTARVPVAVVPAGEDTVAIIDAYGFVITRQPESESLPRVFRGGSPSTETHDHEVPVIDVVFHGEPGEAHSEAGPGLSVVAALPDDLRQWVEAITVDPVKGVGLKLVGGAQAVLGDTSLLDHKVSAVRSVLASAELGCIVLIDATKADLTTVTRHPLC